MFIINKIKSRKVWKFYQKKKKMKVLKFCFNLLQENMKRRNSLSLRNCLINSINRIFLWRKFQHLLEDLITSTYQRRNFYQFMTSQCLKYKKEEIQKKLWMKNLQICRSCWSKFQKILKIQPSKTTFCKIFKEI